MWGTFRRRSHGIGGAHERTTRSRAPGAARLRIVVTLVLLAATYAAAVVMLADIAREAQQQGLLAP